MSASNCKFVCFYTGNKPEKYYKRIARFVFIKIKENFYDEFIFFMNQESKKMAKSDLFIINDSAVRLMIKSIPKVNVDYNFISYTPRIVKLGDYDPKKPYTKAHLDFADPKLFNCCRIRRTFYQTKHTDIPLNDKVYVFSATLVEESIADIKNGSVRRIPVTPVTTEGTGTDAGKDLVTVITPIYNCEESFALTALNFFQNASNYPNLKWIIVDCSTTGNIGKFIPNKSNCDNIKILKSNDRLNQIGSFSVALQYLDERCKYITIMLPNTCYPDDWIRRSVSLLDQEQCQLVFSDTSNYYNWYYDKWFDGEKSLFGYNIGTITMRTQYCMLKGFCVEGLMNLFVDTKHTHRRVQGSDVFVFDHASKFSLEIAPVNTNKKIGDMFSIMRESSNSSFSE